MKQLKPFKLFSDKHGNIQKLPLQTTFIQKYAKMEEIFQNCCHRIVEIQLNIKVTHSEKGTRLITYILVPLL